MSILSIFKSSTGNWDMGRIVGFKVASCFNFAVVWSVLKLHQTPEWASLGTGEGLMLTGVVALIAGKEIAIAKATSTQPSGNTNA